MRSCGTVIGDTGRRAWPAVAGLGATYFVLASLMWEVDPTWGSAFWPAAGVTFAVLVRAPSSRWPALLGAVAGAELVANLLHGTSLDTATWGAVANAVEPAIGACIFRYAGGQRRLAGLGSLAWLLLGGVVVGPAVGAAFGGVLAIGGPAPAVDRWVRWWVGDGVGVLAVAPALLAGRGTWRSAHPIETGGLAVTLVGCATFLASSSPGAVAPSLVLPALVWAALRFGVPGTAVSLIGIASVIHGATATGHGAFAGAGGVDLVAAQVYIACVGISCLTIALLVDDLAQRRRSEMALLHRATHDPLTGLANRALLDVRVQAGDIGAVAVVDLDGFKAINDRHGHLAGDAVLRAVADVLRAACGPDDLAARIGGDEFVVLLAGADERRAEAFELDVQRGLLVPVATLEPSVPVSASIGWATGGGSMLELLERADRDMYQRKRSDPRRPAASGEVRER